MPVGHRRGPRHRGGGVAAGAAQRTAAPVQRLAGVGGYGSAAYQQHSENTSRVLRLLFEKVRGEGLVMPYTMEDFEHDYIKKHFARELHHG